VPRTILLIAHLSPPSPLSAARRTAGFAKYLAQRGHRVVVLTSKVSGSGPIEGAARVVRTRDVMASNLNWRKSGFEALLGQAKGETTTTVAAPPPSKLEDVVVPDLALVGWVPFALPAALKLAREERPDVVWTTGPPPSTNFIGLALQRRLGLPWIADIRDGWRFERNHADFPLAPQRALDAFLDRRLTRSADRVTAVTRPIALDAHERLGATHATTISNGFDLDELQTLTGPPPDGLLSPDRHSLLYTGRLGYAKRSPVSLLDGLRALKAAEPETANRIEVLFAGPLRDDERAQIEAPDLAGMTRVLGSLDRTTTMRLQRATDTLLLITTGNPSETGQKLFEYLASDRPVFVVGDRTEAARIVTEAKAGSAASMEDPAEIARKLSDLVNGRTEIAPGGIAQRFHYAALAAELEDEIEAAIAGRSATTIER
jgi:glycosyltransferase involved in cell wall biosynthesis